jgi:hypothetical protein
VITQETGRGYGTVRRIISDFAASPEQPGMPAL